jgi:hypothetical protein
MERINNMKALYFCILMSVLSPSIFAATVQVSGSSVVFDARDKVEAVSRSRFSMGNGWSSGAANLKVTVNYAGDSDYSSQWTRVGLASSDNPAFLHTEQYYQTICTPFSGCYNDYADGTDHFTVWTLNDLVTPDYGWFNQGALPPEMVWNAASHTLTFNFSPLLASDKSYFLFVETSQFGPTLTYTATLNQVPVPAAAWLFGSGILGLAGISRRLKKGR